MGEIQVPADKYWGAQTQRSLQNFDIGTETMPTELIKAFALVKKSLAVVRKEKLKNFIFVIFWTFLRLSMEMGETIRSF